MYTVSWFQSGSKCEVEYKSEDRAIEMFEFLKANEKYEHPKMQMIS